MIHLFDYKKFDKTSNDALQYANTELIFENVILNTDFFFQKIKETDNFFNHVFFNERSKSSISFEDLCNYIDSNNVELLFFNIELFKDTYQEIIDLICNLSEKYKKIKFIFLNDETFLNYNKEIFYKENVFIIGSVIENPYSYINGVYYLNKFSSYYIMNLYLQQRYIESAKLIFDSSKLLVRQKKYNFYNGIHKPHRLKCYEFVKNNNMLDDGFFSYLDYANFKNDESQYVQFLDFLGFETIHEYLNYLNNFQIPYLCDYINQDINNYCAFSLPLQYSLQSYFSITTETKFLLKNELNNIYFSEKSLKGFFGFNIPLFIGNYTTIKYFKQLGFDLFEDLFDYSFCYDKDDVFLQFEKNLKIISSMSNKEIYFYFQKNLHRIENNFNVLTKSVKCRDLENLNKFLSYKPIL